MNSDRGHSLMQKTAYFFFLTVLIFSPLAFGTVETWSYLIMECLVCASALLLCCSSREEKMFYRAPGLLPLFLVNAFIFFQIIPLPAGFVKILSPTAYAIYQNLTLINGENAWIPLSIYPHATLMELLRFSSYTIFYITGVQFFSDGQLLKRTVAVITGFASVLALVGIVEFVTESLQYPFPHDKIFWIKELSHGGTPMGPYVNRNHYAGLMEMVFPLVLALFLAYRPIMTKISLKKRIADFFNHRRVNQHFLFGTAAILIATSILLSLSRGAILSLSISMIIFSIMLIVKTKRNKAGFFIVFIVVIVLFMTGTSGWDAIFKRFENLRNQSGMIYHVRLIYWEDSIKIFRDFPLGGTGIGTFEKIYPLYRSAPGKDILEHAHNDYLEFLSTGGIILPVLMGWCLFSILHSAGISFMKRREWYSLLLFTGCVTAIAAILLHSVVDFNMQIGANGLYFFLILALAVSSANTRMRPGVEITYLKKSKFHPFLTGISVLFLFMTVVYTHGGTLIANHIISDYRNVALWSGIPKNKLLAINQVAKTSAALDLLNPRYTHITANTSFLLSNTSEAMQYYERSLRLDPKNSQYLMDAAFFLHRQGKQDLSESLFRTSIQYDKTNMAASIKHAAMLLETKQPEKSFQIMKQAISIDPEITDTFLALMVQYHIDDEQLRFALPNRVKPYLVLGDFFNSLGKKEKAEESYLTALEFLSNEEQINKRFFLHVYQFYVHNRQDENALHIILKAISHFPDDSGFHRIAGDLYQKLGIDYRAEEEFRKADILKQVSQ